MTKLEKDIERVDKIIKPYGGQSGAYMVFIMERDGEMKFVLDGTAYLLSIGIAQIIARIASITTRLNYGQLIAAIDKMAKLMVEDSRHDEA